MTRRVIVYLYAVAFMYCYAYCQNATASTKESQLDDTSLNTCLIGHWSQATVWALAYDALRDLAFLGSCGCVYVLDISNPTELIQVSQFKHSLCNTCGFYYDQTAQRLYICSGYSGLRIWDLQNPSQPSELGYYSTPGYACGVKVVNQHAFVACADAGLRVIDISDPSEPKEIGSFCMTSATCVHISDKYAYVTDLGLRILDISMPSNPQEISYYETPGAAFGLDVIEDYAYVADDWCGLRIINISEPKKPEEVSYFLTDGYAWGVQVAESYAYVSACEEGLRVIDVTNVGNPIEVAHYETSEAIVDALVVGSHIYVADVANGLQIIAMTIAGTN